MESESNLRIDTNSVDDQSTPATKNPVLQTYNTSSPIQTNPPFGEKFLISTNENKLFRKEFKIETDGELYGDNIERIEEEEEFESDDDVIEEIRQVVKRSKVRLQKNFFNLL